MEILIINTGGTFNKVYDPVKGELRVPKSNTAIEKILKTLPPLKRRVKTEGVIYKDSLDMTDEDREILLKKTEESEQKYIIIVHGTDTMDISAEYIADRLKDKKIIFTGAMVPFSIDKIEATANLASALSAVSLISEGVYIAMQGLVLPYNRIKKNKEAGVFERTDIESDSIFYS